MMRWVEMIVVFLRALLGDRAELAAENLALRQQLSILEQRSKRPRLRNRLLLRPSRRRLASEVSDRQARGDALRPLH